MVYAALDMHLLLFSARFRTFLQIEILIYCYQVFAVPEELTTNKEADPKGQLLFFWWGEEKFRRITTEN